MIHINAGLLHTVHILQGDDQADQARHVGAEAAKIAAEVQGTKPVEKMGSSFQSSK